MSSSLPRSKRLSRWSNSSTSSWARSRARARIRAGSAASRPNWPRTRTRSWPSATWWRTARWCGCDRTPRRCSAGSSCSSSFTAAALTIALGLTRYISRPIAALDASIRQLGGADFSREITVRGPEDLQSLGERLDWLRRRLAELEAEKNRFLRHLSHELKTPLTVLREGAELLNDQVGGPLAPPQRQVVAIMRDNSVKLQRLIEDLLDYQRALHAAASLVPRSVALDALVQDVARPHQLAVQAKGQRLELDLDKVSVEADPEKLRSIIDNLLGNAVKFTPTGGTIRVLTRAADREAMVDVIDTGPGVPLEERESIFDSFFRGRAKESGRIEGTGLGLAIAREFVEAHGGRISVVSETSGGHFRVTLPRKPARALPVAA